MQTQDSSNYLSHDTIAALATALGGAVTIVRVSGPRCQDVLKELVPGAAAGATQEPRSLKRARVLGAKGCLIDDGLVVYFCGPHSFTGEDCIEFQLHAGAVIVSQLMEALLKMGVRQALPGEFSFRAVRNGKMDISQAQATADLISAKNEMAHQIALEKMEGSQNYLLSNVAESLRHLAMLGEAGIDFSDQEIDEVSLGQLQKKLGSIFDQLENLRQSYGRGKLIQDGLRVALVGSPNAGKSSFFNALIGEDRSIVSDVAGTTRDIVGETVTLRSKRHSITIRIEDTAGIRANSHHEATHEIEKLGIERTRNAARNADLILLVLEAGATPQMSSQLYEHWVGLGATAKNTLGILSKVDLAGRQDVAANPELGRFGLKAWCPTSALTGEGIAEAAHVIADFCGEWLVRKPAEVILTRLDQLRAVEQCLACLGRAREASSLELFSADLRHALVAMEGLIGQTPPDDILGRLFSTFCIGK